MALSGLPGISPWHEVIYDNAPGKPHDAVLFTDLHWNLEIAAANAAAMKLFAGKQSCCFVEGKRISFHGSCLEHFQTCMVENDLEIWGWEPEENKEDPEDPTFFSSRNQSLIETILRHSHPGAGSDPELGPNFFIAGQAHLVPMTQRHLHQAYPQDLLLKLKETNFIILKSKTIFSEEIVLKHADELYANKVRFSVAFFKNFSLKLLGECFSKEGHLEFIPSMQSVTRQFLQSALADLKHFRLSGLASKLEPTSTDFFMKKLRIHIRHIIDDMKLDIMDQIQSIHPDKMVVDLLQSDLNFLKNPTPRENPHSWGRFNVQGENLFIGAAWYIAAYDLDSTISKLDYKLCEQAGTQAYLNWLHEAIYFVFDSLDKDPFEAEQEFNELIHRGISSTALVMKEAAHPVHI